MGLVPLAAAALPDGNSAGSMRATRARATPTLVSRRARRPSRALLISNICDPLVCRVQSMSAVALAGGRAAWRHQTQRKGVVPVLVEGHRIDGDVRLDSDGALDDRDRA